MTDYPFTPLRVDHVELFVPDRAEAAAWYGKALGLQPVPGTEAWAADPEGPVMLSADGGETKLALFKGQPQGPRLTAGWHRVAFQVTAQGLVAFLRHAEALGLRERGDPLRLRDHGAAISVYFSDPYGHRLEITTYDPGPVRDAIPSSRFATPDPAKA